MHEYSKMKPNVCIANKLIVIFARHIIVTEATVATLVEIQEWVKTIMLLFLCVTYNLIFGM